VPDLQSLLDSQKRLNGVRANFVVNNQGHFTGESGSSREISNENDLVLLKKLRSLSDVIVTDAKTARMEQYRPSKFAPIEIWSKTGDFTGLTAEQGLSFRITPDVVRTISELVNIYRSVLLETGPTLTNLLGNAKAIDELKLTVVGAPSQQDAILTASSAKESLGLNYLKLIECQSLGDSWFLTLGR